MTPTLTLLKEWLELARFAPSAHNTQPWRCRLVEDTVEIFIDPENQLTKGDPTMRETLLGIGCFTENLLQVASSQGCTAEPQIAFMVNLEQPVVKLAFKVASPNQSSTKLAQFISKRHTNRGLYKSEPLELSLLKHLEAVATPPNTFFTFVTKAENKNAIGQLVGKGVKIGLSFQSMRQELADLVSFAEEKRPTGMLVEAMQEQFKPAETGEEWFLEKLDVTEEASFCQRKFSQAPLLVIVSSQMDGPISWIESGMALERLLLTATSLQLSHCISAAPVEVPTLAPLLRQHTINNTRPQALIRLGFPQNPAFSLPSPRRSIEDILKG